MDKKVQVLLNILFVFLIFWTLVYLEEVSNQDPLLNIIHRIEFSIEQEVMGIGFQNDTLVVKTAYYGISKNPKNGSLLFIRDGKIVKNITLLPFDDYGAFDVSESVVVLGTYGIKWLSESIFTFSPSYLVAYSPEGSELWRKEFNTTSVSAAGNLIVARGYMKNGSVVKVFNISGNELWCLYFGEKVATNGKVVAVAEKGRIYLFSRDGSLMRIIEPWKGTVDSMKLMEDGKLVVAFYSRDSSHLGVYDENGNLIWVKNFQYIRDFAVSRNYILVYDGALHILDFSGTTLWNNTAYYPMYPDMGMALGRIAISADERFVAFGTSGVNLVLNPLFDRDKDGVIDKRDPIPLNNDLFYRILVTIISGAFATWVNWRERKKERKKAKEEYLELKERFERVR